MLQSSREFVYIIRWHPTKYQKFCSFITLRNLLNLIIKFDKLWLDPNKKFLKKYLKVILGFYYFPFN